MERWSRQHPSHIMTGQHGPGPILNALMFCNAAAGGWREPTHTGAYQLLLKGRHGFISLALETGAQLVPVLCLGEHLLTTDAHIESSPSQDPMTGNWFRRLLFAERPGPVRVVFGQAVQGREGESVQSLYSRYVQALQALAEQHGVEVSIIGAKE